MRQRKITGQEKMWKIIRAMKRVTAADLVQLAEVSWSFACRYLRALRYVGYLREEGTKKMYPGAGKGQKVYVLVKDTGPKAPRIRPVCELRDPNTGERFCTQENY